MKAIWNKYYDKALAFAAGIGLDALLDISGWLKAIAAKISA